MIVIKDIDRFGTTVKFCFISAFVPFGSRATSDNVFFPGCNGLVIIYRQYPFTSAVVE